LSTQAYSKSGTSRLAKDLAAALDPATMNEVADLDEALRKSGSGAALFSKRSEV
jgi:hypothetical protein